MLAGVTREMPAFREEICGPVAPVTVVKDGAEAIEVANDSEYGLVAAIQTGAVGRGLELARSLRTGMVHVNDQTLNNDAYAPFGGVGASAPRLQKAAGSPSYRPHPLVGLRTI